MPDPGHEVPNRTFQRFVTLILIYFFHIFFFKNCRQTKRLAAKITAIAAVIFIPLTDFVPRSFARFLEKISLKEAVLKRLTFRRRIGSTFQRIRKILPFSGLPYCLRIHTIPPLYFRQPWKNAKTATSGIRALAPVSPCPPYLSSRPGSSQSLRPNSSGFAGCFGVSFSFGS